MASSAVTTSAQAPHPQVPHLTAQEALLYDAHGYALDQGITLDEATRRLQLQDLVGELSATLRTEEQETFAGLRIQHKPEFRVVVYLTNGGQEVVRPYVEHGPLADIIDIRPARVSLTALEAEQDRVMHLVDRLGIPVGGDINIIEGQVQIHVTDPAQFSRALDAARIRLPTTVTVLAVDELPTPEGELYGGLAINGPTEGCTSGFSVLHPASGVKGIVTAGHCEDTLTYDGVTLQFGGQLESGAYDIQFNKQGSHNVHNMISTGASTRGIYAKKSRAQQALDQYVCKYGRTTGFTCGYIVSFNSVYQGTAAWIRVHRDGVNLSEPGDSGAPWFNGNTAYGVHAAGAGDDSLYQSTDYAESPLNVIILTE